MKKELPPKPFLFPMPAVLVGANVNGKPNYLTVAFCGIMNLEPPMVALGLGRSHYTNPGIVANQSFSVNVPSAAMAAAVDYCGIHSGHRVDKSQVFKTFYGKLATAPMAEEAPLNLECKLIQVVELKADNLFIGEIVSAFATDDVLTDGFPDPLKLDPLCFSVTDRKYYRMGAEVGQAWSMGKDYQPR
jgi:flavin reductase (DIM6/NTAB) family NADH-FMN oxidoreductase RutF